MCLLPSRIAQQYRKNMSSLLQSLLTTPQLRASISNDTASNYTNTFTPWDGD